MRLEGGDIAFKISYTAWNWPFGRPRYFRFVAENSLVVVFDGWKSRAIRSAGLT
jgi:hypothetical protein